MGRVIADISAFEGNPDDSKTLAPLLDQMRQPWLTKLKRSFMTEVARELKTSRELQLAHLENHLKEIRYIRRERKERSLGLVP